MQYKPPENPKPPEEELKRLREALTEAWEQIVAGKYDDAALICEQALENNEE